MSEPKKVSRREYVKYGASFAAGAVIAGAGVYLAAPRAEAGPGVTATTTVTAPGTTVTKTATAAPEKATLKFWMGENPAIEKAYNDIIFTEFQKFHPDVSFKMETSDHNTFVATLVTRHTGPDPPDMTSMWIDPSRMGGIADAGGLLVTDEYADKYNWWDKLGMHYVHKGKLYGVIQNSWILPMYYNVDLFEKNGWTVPETEEEFYELCADVKKKGLLGASLGPRDVIGYFDNALCHLLHSALDKDRADKLFDGYGPYLSKETYSDLPVRWTDPDVVEAIQLYEIWRDEVLVTDFMAMGIDEAHTLFFAQKTPMMPQGTWVAAMFGETAKFKLSTFHIPGRKRQLVAGHPGGLVIAKATKNPDLCAEFVDFMITNKESLKFLANYAGGVINSKLFNPSYYETPIMQDIMSWGLKYPWEYEFRMRLSPKLFDYWHVLSQKIAVKEITAKQMATELEDYSKKIAEGTV